MKIVTALGDRKPAFKPVSVTFVFETQKELDEMGRLFNYSQFADVFRKRMGWEGYFFQFFEDIGADVVPTDEWRHDLGQHLSTKCTKPHFPY